MAVQLAWLNNGAGMPLFDDAGLRIATIMAQLTFSGSYSTGGDTLDLGQLFGTQLVGNSAAPPGFSLSLVTNTAPSLWVGEINSQPPASGSSASGYLYYFKGGTNLNNCKVQILQSAAAGNPHTELSAGAYPAGITGDTVYMILSVPK